MTMIEERALRAALREAAESIPVPDLGAEQILRAAERLDARPRVGFASRTRRGTESGASGFPDEHRADGDALAAALRKRLQVC